MPKQIQTQIPNPQGRIFQDLDIWTLGIPKGFCQIPAFSPGVFLFLSALASCSSSLPAQHSSSRSAQTSGGYAGNGGYQCSTMPLDTSHLHPSTSWSRSIASIALYLGEPRLRLRPVRYAATQLIVDGRTCGLQYLKHVFWDSKVPI